MTGWELLARGWDFEPSVVAGCGLLLGGYLVAVRFRLDGTAWRFAAGVLLTFLALVSPLDTLSDTYLFSAHMLQHIVLAMVAPALFVLGLPERLARRILGYRPAARAERWLGRPLVAWVFGIGTLAVWHVPVLYDATLASEGIHVFEHLTFLVTGCMLWWPVLAPLPAHRLPPLPAVVYLALAATANGLLGIFFTFATRPFYAGYAHPRDELGALDLVRRQWGLDRVADQQLGGALMWVLGSVIFLTGILGAVARWVREEEPKRA